jgi:CelD/BcsL family acetyltransferase involved in cellulose biosynthesis
VTGSNGGEVREAPLLEVLADASAVAALVPAWRELATVAARSPLESPDWLVPWFRHYGQGAEPRILTWRSDGRLAGVAPLVVSKRRRGVTLTELGFWGGAGPALRGLVDVLALDACRDAILASLAAWLRSGDCHWDLLNALRLPASSTTAELLVDLSTRAGWRHVRLGGVVRSDTFVLDLPPTVDGWRSHLGPKARHNMRTEERRFAHLGGHYEIVTDPAASDELCEALRRLMAERWGDAEINFRPDPAFGPFVGAVFTAMLAAGSMYAHVARDRSGIRACLVTFVLHSRAAAILVGVSVEDDVRPLSLGKHLFDASIETAIGAGCTTYDFLWVGGYKEAFWHARPRRLESILVGRGPLGSAAANYVALRRVVLPTLLRRWARARNAS